MMRMVELFFDESRCISGCLFRVLGCISFISSTCVSITSIMYDLVVISLVPGSGSLKKVLVKLAITTDLVHLINDIVALHEDQEATPDEVSITRGLSQEERSLGVLLQQSLDLLDRCLRVSPSLLAALLLVELIERLAGDLGSRLVPVRKALLAEDVGGNGVEVDGLKGAHDLWHDGEELGENG